MRQNKPKKKTAEEVAGELWELATKLRTNGQKVDLVVDCENPSEVNPILAKLSRLYNTKTLFVANVFPKNEWRLRE